MYYACVLNEFGDKVNGHVSWGKRLMSFQKHNLKSNSLGVWHLGSTLPYYLQLFECSRKKQILSYCRS